MFSPAIDRPQCKGNTAQPDDGKSNSVAGPISMDGGLQDSLTTANYI